jgi:nucleoside-diphosphate-sugar epimerase
MSKGRLLIFGLGYVGQAVAGAALTAGFSVTATKRDPGRNATPPGIDIVKFDDASQALSGATHLFCTAPPPLDDKVALPVCPVLRRYHAEIAASPSLSWAGYCSSTGVYGDHAGGWVDEATAPNPGQTRSYLRRAAEQAWETLAARLAVDLFRLAGIYGPGRSALDAIRSERAQLVRRTGHVFCRIHRDDIVAAALAAMHQKRPPGTRVLNLADDMPAEGATVLEEAAQLLGKPTPPALTFDDARSQMSPMALSFWEESRRVSSANTQALLNLRWRYPSYREGLRAILAAERTDSVARSGEGKR